jgi:hypothetical protein
MEFVKLAETDGISEKIGKDKCPEVGCRKQSETKCSGKMGKSEGRGGTKGFGH